MHPGQKLHPGARVVFAGRKRTSCAARCWRSTSTAAGRCGSGPTTATDVDAVVDAIGHVPLPPYIHRPDQAGDRERYQTVYARERGSVAAPTAGLHLTARLLDELRARGVGARRDHAARRLRHVSAGARRPKSRTTPSSPSGSRSARPRPRHHRGARRGPPGRGRRHDDDEDARDAARETAGDGCARRAATADSFIYPGLHVPGARRPAHQFPPAAVVAAHAGVRVRRPRSRPGRVPRGGRRRLPVLQLRRRDADRLRRRSGADRLHFRRRPRCGSPTRNSILTGIRTYPLKSRKSKARTEQFARPYRPGSGHRRLARVAAVDPRARRTFAPVVACASSTARSAGRGIVWGFGAHVIKTGLVARR